MIKLTAAYVEKIITEKHGCQIKPYHSPVTLTRSIFQSVCKEKQKLDYFSFLQKKKKQHQYLLIWGCVGSLWLLGLFFLVAVHRLLTGWPLWFQGTGSNTLRLQ